MLKSLIGIVSILVGILILSVSSYYQYKVFPKIAKDQDTVLSIHALRHSSFLSLVGSLFILIGILYLMLISVLN
jgi:hypothetical protein